MAKKKKGYFAWMEREGDVCLYRGETHGPGVHVRPHLPRRELEHVAPPGGVLGEGAGGEKALGFYSFRVLGF